MRHLAGSSASCTRAVGLTLSRYDVLGSLRFGFRPDGRHNRPISAHSQAVASLRASATILVSRLESRSRQLREAPFGKVRRNISSTC